jgi:hypothetical protein
MHIIFLLSCRNSIRHNIQVGFFFYLLLYLPELTDCLNPILKCMNLKAEFKEGN